MNSFKDKVRWSVRYITKILLELFKDLWTYYVSAYPLMLIIGSYRRIMRRLKIIWLPKPKGRPPVHENVEDLILDMKRSNLQWGAQRISDELRLMGIQVSKKTVLKILRINGFMPPNIRFSPPPWRSVLDSFSRHWAMALPLFLIVRAHNYSFFLFWSYPHANWYWLTQLPAQPVNGWCSSLGIAVYWVINFHQSWYMIVTAYMVIGCQKYYDSMAAYHARRHPDRLGVILMLSASTEHSRMNS